MELGRCWRGVVLAVLPAPAFASVSQLASSVAPYIAAGALALGVAAALWAAALVSVVRRLRRDLREVGANTRAAVGARDALISASRDALVAWGGDETLPRSYRAADRIVESCLAGPDAPELAEALDALSDRGVPFLLSIRDERERPVTLRGRAVGAMAAIWVEASASAAAIDFRAVLDTISMPVWLRDSAKMLAWGNRAWLDATGQPDMESALAAQTALDRSDRDLASAARSEGRAMEVKRYAVVGGQRRALALSYAPIPDGSVVGSANDVTDLSNAEARLQQHLDAHADTL
ncbi:MAG TPA: PAS domain-containing protein, partial [Rhizomicrobium sp.]